MRTLGLTLSLMLAGCAQAASVEQNLSSGSAHPANQPTDPAVIYANTLAGTGSPYRQGWSGEGDDRIHYVEAGEGQTILFVHGFPSFWYVWHDQMEALRHCRRVIAIDAPGAGLSAKPEADEAYRVETLAMRLHELIGELAPGEKITLVGHDWGGALAWSYAQNDPNRLERLAVFSAPPYNLLLDLLANDAEQRAASSYMPRLLNIDRETASTEAFATSFFELAYRRMVDTGVLSEREGQLFEEALSRDQALYAGIQWYKANLPDFDALDPAQHYWPERDKNMDIPILLIRGSEDRTFVKRMGDFAKRDAPQLQVTELPDVGHWTPFQKPELATSRLKAFVLDENEKCAPVVGTDE